MDSIIEANGVVKMPMQKDKFVFSKSLRFSPPKVLNDRVSYEPKMSDFEITASNKYS